jgi:hypothetical protein
LESEKEFNDSMTAMKNFKNHLVPNVFGEFNSKNSPCSSKKSTNHELPISCPEITNDATINSEAI